MSTNAFVETPVHGVGQSKNKQRGGILNCPDGVTAVSRYVGMTPGGIVTDWQNQGAMPQTKAGGKWRINIKFEVFGDPPSVLWPAGYPDDQKVEDVILGFFRYDRSGANAPDTFAAGVDDAYRGAQWIDGAFVADRLVDVGDPAHLYAPWMIPSFATGDYGGLIDGFPATTGLGNIHTEFGRYTRLIFAGYDQGEMRNLARAGSYVQDACTKRIDWADIVAGYIWQDEFTIPPVPYCSPAWVAAAYVHSGAGTFALGGDASLPGGRWTFPPSSDSNPQRFAWKLSFTAVRFPTLQALFKANLGVGNQVSFVDLSQGIPVSWDWDFGDGETSEEQNPQHTYSGPGQFTVSLRVTNAYGEAATHTAVITVPLVAKFSFAPGIYPRVQFTNLSVNAATFDWNFGDGSPHNTAASPEHAFPVGTGTYDVTLTVGDGAGNTDQFTLQVKLGPALAANWTWAALPSPAHTVQFTDTSTGALASWNWTFLDVRPGGGTVTTLSSVQNPQHTFLQAGVRNQITLLVTDVYGFTASRTGQISAP